jgi:hypothetical protein
MSTFDGKKRWRVLWSRSDGERGEEERRRGEEWIDRHTDRQIDRHTDLQTERRDK